MLRIANLTHTYANGVQALRGLTLDIPNGMFGLLGPNGAGKSTLMRTIATLQQPSGGSLTFDDIDVLTQPQRLRQVLGYLPQEFGVYPRVSAEDMLTHLAVLKGLDNAAERREQVAALLHQTNLYAVRKKALSGFSGGMRQRFGIAQALLGSPRLIIVDEPTAGLDPEERNRFHTLLSDIGSNVVVILSTHIVGDVADLCPRMAIIEGGQIVTQGEPAALVDAMRGRIWRKVVDKTEVEAHRQDYAVIANRLSGGRSVLHVLADTQPGPGFDTVPGDLEDVYFAALHQRRAPALAAA